MNYATPNSTYIPSGETNPELVVNIPMWLVRECGYDVTKAMGVVNRAKKEGVELVNPNPQPKRPTSRFVQIKSESKDYKEVMKILAAERKVQTGY